MSQVLTQEVERFNAAMPFHVRLPGKNRNFHRPLNSGRGLPASAGWATATFATNDMATTAPTTALVVLMFMFLCFDCFWGSPLIRVRTDVPDLTLHATVGCLVPRLR
jgi:hypothetical protein